MANEESGLGLDEFLGGIIGAIVRARRLGDLETRRIVDQYSTEEELAPFAAPSFVIAEVSLDLRFAITEVPPSATSDSRDVRVAITRGLLEDLADHQVSRMTLRFVPQEARTIELPDRPTEPPT